MDVHPECAVPGAAPAHAGVDSAPGRGAPDVDGGLVGAAGGGVAHVVGAVVAAGHGGSADSVLHCDSGWGFAVGSNCMMWK